MFSKACQYGIKASVYVALQSSLGIRANLKEIAKNIDSPEAFTAKVLHQLAKNNLMDSHKGPTGGFVIDSAQAKNIRLSDIVKAIDGDRIYNGCALGFDKCDAEKPCPMHYHFVSIRNNLKNMLEQTSLFDLANELVKEPTFLKR